MIIGCRDFHTVFIYISYSFFFEVITFLDTMNTFEMGNKHSTLLHTTKSLLGQKKALNSRSYTYTEMQVYSNSDLRYRTFFLFSLYGTQLIHKNYENIDNRSKFVVIYLLKQKSVNADFKVSGKIDFLFQNVTINHENKQQV